MARKIKSENLKLYIGTGATAINDSICGAITDGYTNGKRVVYVSASLRTAHIFNRVGKELFGYNESECNLGSVTITHADNGFSVKKLMASYPEADILAIDDMSVTKGYPFGLIDELDALKKLAGDGKRVLAGIVMSRKKDLASGLANFVEDYASKNGIPYEEVKRGDDEGDEDTPAEGDEDAPSESEHEPENSGEGESQ